jgi:hypothetical protein
MSFSSSRVNPVYTPVTWPKRSRPEFSDSTSNEATSSKRTNRPSSSRLIRPTPSQTLFDSDVDEDDAPFNAALDRFEQEAALRTPANGTPVPTALTQVTIRSQAPSVASQELLQEYEPEPEPENEEQLLQDNEPVPEDEDEPMLIGNALTAFHRRIEKAIIVEIPNYWKYLSANARLKLEQYKHIELHFPANIASSRGASKPTYSNSCKTQTRFNLVGTYQLATESRMCAWREFKKPNGNWDPLLLEKATEYRNNLNGGKFYYINFIVFPPPGFLTSAGRRQFNKECQDILGISDNDMACTIKEIRDDLGNLLMYGYKLRMAMGLALEFTTLMNKPNNMQAISEGKFPIFMFKDVILQESKQNYNGYLLSSMNMNNGKTKIIDLGVM